MAQSGRGGVTRAGTIDVYLAVCLLGVVYAVLVAPLILASCSPLDRECLYGSRPDNKIFWPALAAISVAMVGVNWRRLAFPPHIVSLSAFVAFAGASVVWAYRPDLSAIRYVQQVMIVVSVVLPALIAVERGDLLRGLFLCFALAAFVNVFFVMGPPPNLGVEATPGYAGYFSGKNYLGIFAAITVLLAFHELLQPGMRRWVGLVVGVIASILLVMSNSKTALGLAFVAPFLAAFAVLLRRTLRLPVLFLPLAILAAYFVMSNVAGINIYKISYWIFGDSTFTGRKAIWDFADYQIWKRPLLGWGYQSFWLVGPNAPSVVEAPGWVKTMPNGHNGYKDTTLEMGYVGFVLLVTFIGTTLHACGRVIDRDPARGWTILSLAIFIMIINGFESMWMRAFEFVWLVFLVLAADLARQSRRYAFDQVQTGTPVERPNGPLQRSQKPRQPPRKREPSAATLAGNGPRRTRVTARRARRPRGPSGERVGE